LLAKIPLLNNPVLGASSVQLGFELEGVGETTST
jgi:hypothetical protein